MNLQHEMLQFAAEKQMWQAGHTIVAAVSGGPDSMALLHMLYSVAEQQQLQLVVAHVNHGYRPEESAIEQAAVAQYAEQLKLPFEAVQLSMPSYIEENNLNSQAAAREKRYEFLHIIADRYCANSIALAHHADDQAETVMMRLIRGAGLTGLAGIPSKRNDKTVSLIRPLLRMNKTDIIDYCQQHQVPYYIDSSNLQKHYFRNQVRLDVLPYLMQYNPQLSSSLQRIAEVAGEEDDWMQQQTQKAFEQLVEVKQDQCIIRVDELAKLHVALQRRLIKLILSYLSKESDSFSFERIDSMRMLAASDGPSTNRLDAGLHIQVRREYDYLRWLYSPQSLVEQEERSYSITISEAAGSVYSLPGGWTMELEVISAHLAVMPSSRYEACFDAEQLIFPLELRNRRPGDRMQVLGLKGSKKVQDMFVDAKIAPLKRMTYPLLCDSGGRLLWIPGIRRSNIALTNPDTREIIIMRAKQE
ncbi:tRNA lysidine(34) synthetase TilS [Paenibacillus sp. GXUN7292]|uniref:tRNA lysidine(34) synthetase TilS n=1 Tax=Paenibacillus sp. GXUN7292 TaxID=3422499 RepID=UPI003D7F14DC